MAPPHSHPHHKDDAKAQIKHHAHMEHLGQATALLAGAVAMHEKSKARKDLQHAHHHHVIEAVAGAVAVGAGAYAAHEHHQKKAAKKAAKHGHH